MPAAIEEIADLLSKLNLPCHITKRPNSTNSDYLVFLNRTNFYVDPENRPFLTIVVALEEEGQFMRVVAPEIYRIEKDSPHRGAVMQTLLHICFNTKLLQFEFDPVNLVIRGVVEFPIQDNNLTDSQLMRCIAAVTTCAEQYHSMIRDALTQGITPDDESFLRSHYEFELLLMRLRKGDLGLGE
jgi:hypothetical protein